MKKLFARCQRCRYQCAQIQCAQIQWCGHQCGQNQNGQSQSGQSQSGQSQSGYALLLGLMALMVVSAIWLGAASAHRVNYKKTQTLQLSQARDALIHYAVNYIDHYGVQGAGPGHFPCPDTDPPEHSNVQLTDPWIKDGPNPPCGKSQIASGWLPRHVNVNNGRYHFHSRSQQRLRYAVSNQFINNPINRVVNADSVSDIKLGQFDNVIAVVSLPSYEFELDRSMPQWSFEELINNSAYAVVRTDDILKPLMRRVGSWLLGQLNSALEQFCRNGSNSTGCAQEWAWQVKCEALADTMLLHWLTRNAIDASCPESTESLLASKLWLEDVPLKRHWFVRNRWYQFIDLQIDGSCKPELAAHCRFAIVGIKDAELQLTLTPVEPSSP